MNIQYDRKLHIHIMRFGELKFLIQVLDLRDFLKYDDKQFRSLQEHFKFSADGLGLLMMKERDDLKSVFNKFVISLLN